MNLEGEIAEIDLIERLVVLWRDGFTGAIRFENDGIIKIIYFKGGDVLSASTNDRADSVDEILMRAGKVTRDHVKQALSKRKENETLGDALLNLGFITRKELTWARRVQVIGVIRSIAAWENGSFTIVADYLPKREEGTLFPLPQILVELIVTEQDRQRFERALEGGSVVYKKSPEFDDVFRRLGLNEDADAIVSEIDGINTAADVATSSGRETFNVYKLLHALATLGVLQRVGKPEVAPEVSPVVASTSFEDFSFETAGVADAADAWDAPAATEPPAGDWDALPPVQPSAIPNDWSTEGTSFNLADSSTGAVDELPMIMPASGISFDDEPMELPAPLAPPPLKPEPEWALPEPEVSAPAIADLGVDPMPAWEEAPPAPAAKSEPQWGFDEAQIEAARRASTPPPPITPAPSLTASPRFVRPKKKSRSPLLGILLTILILAGAGYAAWWWWQNREQTPTQTASAAPAPVTTTTAAPAPSPAATATLVPYDVPTTTSTDAPNTTTTAAATTTNVAPATATSQPPVPATTQPPSAPAPPQPEPQPTAALPVVTPRTAAPATGDRARYDAMAAEFAATAVGGFTVQLAIICDPVNITKSLNAGGSNVWFVPISYRGKSCYRVFWGRYDSRQAATSATSSIPASLRNGATVVSSPKR